MKKAFFFDMDGILFDSMPHHSQAWEEIMSKYNLNFTVRDCYLQEGRTGQSVIDECFIKNKGRHATAEEVEQIYGEKTARFFELGGAEPIDGVKDVLNYLKNNGALIFIVTGSGQQSLFDVLHQNFPETFTRERMITAFDVAHCKPNPEPYLKAFEKAKFLSHDDNFKKSDCCVIENAPLGIRSAREAGLDTYAVNTGPLKDSDLLAEQPTMLFHNMKELLAYLQIF